MRMPGTEQWKPSFVKDTIRFDRSLARQTHTIAKLMGSAGRESVTEPDDALFAFVHAAELAFATGQVEVGLRQCRDILKFAARKPMTSMQKALLATIGSITGKTEVILTQRGALVSGEKEGDETNLSFEGESTPYVVDITRMLIAAWAADRRRGDERQSFNPEILSTGAIRAAVLDSDECRVVFGREAQLRPRSQYEAVLRMIDSYSYRLGVMRSDREYWDQLIPQGDLIDWSLLALLLFVFRTSPWVVDSWGINNPDGIFICELAKSILDLTVGDRRR